MMESTLGWIELSPDALRQMKRELDEGGDDVVDELGVLNLHTGYADRFFPGTSVLHTRPRYLFFVCWNFLALARDAGVTRATLRREKEAAELWITKQLKAGAPDVRGIIGGRVYPRPPSQPIDFVYWTALRTFGFYHGADRARLAREWGRVRIRHIQDGEAKRYDEEDVAEATLATFRCPPPPRWWQGQRIREQLTFALTREEADFLKERLVHLAEACLLSEAAHLLPQQRPAGNTELWDDPLILLAAQRLGQEALLERAHQASAMAKLLRGIYGALVEKVAIETDPARGKGDRSYQRRLLSLWHEESGDVEHAFKLALEDMKSDIPGLSATFCALLTHVQDRASQVRRDADVQRLLLDDMTEDLVCRVERQRKGDRRSRLPRTPAGFERRRDFGDSTVRVYGLDYRWAPVRTLLVDLAEGLKA